ncbi:MAG TPA: sulfatase [Phycisphaerae bacterium]|nr:sulfatase [Phycisphaerae bacterium]HRR84004.1 sulfatase [Phycisphaerae bacterium]
MRTVQRSLWSTAVLQVAFFAFSGAVVAADRPPNFVIIFADDLGYGDLGCYGHPTIRTPNLDRMAAEGMRFTQFYSAGEVCTPSRAALMTGRLPIRSGMCSDNPRVLFPSSAGGIPDGEVTLGEALKARGYATMCVGKWHLGHLPQYLPTKHGFDGYFGIPYSNDMKPTPLMRNEQTVEEPAVQETLTPRYTEEAVRFIKANRDKPFFLYFAHTFPHVPLHASARYKGTSPRGLYGDVVEELDWSVGHVLQTLRELGLAQNTLVFFTSDNGPWLTQRQNGGSAGLLRDGKGSTWEGGMREPGIAWWPGRIKAGQVTTALAGTMDLFPTFVRLAGGEIPKDRVLDGVDMGPVLFGTGPGNRNIHFYYRGQRLMAVRKGPWKAHLITQDGYGKNIETHDPPLLFQLEQDPSERFDVAKEHPDVVADLLAEIERHKATVQPVKCQLTDRVPGE